MTLYEFNLLSESRQIDLLYLKGIYQGKRRHANMIVLLYQLEMFYVEIYYKKYRNYITRVKCFHSTDLLQPYLEQIDVEELMKYAE